MRIWLIFLFILLGPGLMGCTADESDAGEYQEVELNQQQKDSEAWKAEFLNLLESQLRNQTSSFVLSLEDGTAFAGKETTAGWELESAKKEDQDNIRLVQKGGEITLTRGGETEKLTSRQFGLAAPRDHLKLVQESVQWVRKEEQNGRIWFEVDLNSSEMGDKLGNWMGEDYDADAANNAGRQFTFLYRFQFQDGHLQVMEMKITPLQDPASSEKIVYTFK